MLRARVKTLKLNAPRKKNARKRKKLRTSKTQRPSNLKTAQNRLQVPHHVVQSLLQAVKRNTARAATHYA
jgi:hypothetical protein